jgi:hypothetical protein
VARLGTDVVVSVSRFEVVVRYHQPEAFPGTLSDYRQTLNRWHYFELSDRRRQERWMWRIETAKNWSSAGHSSHQIAAWMFEGESYITELLSKSPQGYATPA